MSRNPISNHDSNRYVSVINNNNIGIGFISNKFKIIWCNSLIIQLFGNITEKNFNEIFPEIASIAKIFEKQLDSFEFDKQVVDTNGLLVSIKVCITPIFKDDGNIDEAMITVIPISIHENPIKDYISYNQNLTFKGNILLVDINPQDINIITQFGCNVHVVSEISDFIKAYHTKSYDLVIISCDNKSINCYDISKQIRILDADKDEFDRIPIIAYTSDRNSLINKDYLDVGINDLIYSPCSAETIENIFLIYLETSSQTNIELSTRKSYSIETPTNRPTQRLAPTTETPVSLQKDTGQQTDEHGSDAMVSTGEHVSSTQQTTIPDAKSLSPIQTHEIKLADLPIIDLQKSLVTVNGKKELLIRAVKVYISTSGEQIRSVRIAIEKDEPLKNYLKKIVSIKQTAESLGAVRVAHLAEKICESIEQNQNSKVYHLLYQLIRALTDLENEIEKYDDRYLSVFNFEKALLGANGKENLLIKVLNMFLGAVSEKYQKILAAFVTNDTATARLNVHALKGTAFTVGAERLGNLLMKAESDIKQGAMKDASSRLNDFEYEFDLFKKEIKEFIQSAQNAANSEKSR